MKQIPLSQGKFALVDDEDYDYLMQWKWTYKKQKTNEYAARNEPIGNGKRKTVKMHREIMKFPNCDVDHKDSNGLNNQKYNLRIATRSQNLMNGRKRNNTSSIYKGVSYYYWIGKYCARIRINGKLKFLGNFDNEIDAALAYNIKAIELFGDFALLNEIP